MALDSSLDPQTAAQEWRAYVEPLLPLGERLVTKMLADQQDPQLRQEMYRLVFSSVSLAFMGLFLGDTEQPDFLPVLNSAYNFGSPNPDYMYYLSPLASDGIYKISGFRGTVKSIDFQIGSGLFWTQGKEHGPTFDNYDIDHLHIGKDGAFEVILSQERPAGYQGDWWKLDARATYVVVRQISYDWLNEVDGRLAIERLDTPAMKPRLSEQDIKERLDQLAAWADSWCGYVVKVVDRWHSQGLINKVTIIEMADAGAFTGAVQRYVAGLFDIGPDEALIYETEIPEQARYWSIALNDMNWTGLDWINRQTSLNGHQARLDSDGKFRAVISANDPGVPNWLDTIGYLQGTFFGRWKECSSTPTPRITKVKLAEVRNHLPADTPVVTAQERDVALRLRRKGAQLRRRW